MLHAPLHNDDWDTCQPTMLWIDWFKYVMIISFATTGQMYIWLIEFLFVLLSFWHRSLLLLLLFSSFPFNSYFCCFVVALFCSSFADGWFSIKISIGHRGKYKSSLFFIHTYNVTIMLINYSLQTLTQCRYASNYYKCHTLFKKAAPAAAARTSPHQLVCSAVLCHSAFFPRAHFTCFPYSLPHLPRLHVFLFPQLHIHHQWAAWGERKRDRAGRRMGDAKCDTFLHCRPDIFSTKNAMQNSCRLMMSGCFFYLLKKYAHCFVFVSF